MVHWDAITIIPHGHKDRKLSGQLPCKTKENQAGAGELKCLRMQKAATLSRQVKLYCLTQIMSYYSLAN